MQKFLVHGLLAGLLAVAPAGASSQSVKIAGTRVFISVPEGFTPAENFSGLIKKDADASITVTEIPGPYEKIVNSFTATELAAKGMNLTASSVIKKGHQDASLIEFTQVAFGKKFKKVACIFGDRSNTTLVTGSLPDGGSAELFTTLKNAVQTAHFDSHSRLGAIDEGLRFTIADTKKLKKATRLQNTLLFTTNGKAEPGKDNGPMFVAGHSVGDVLVENRESFAKDRLEHSPQVKNVIIDKSASIKQAGLEGEEFFAKGVDSQDGTPTYIYHAMLFDKDGYYIFQGLCPAGERAVFEPEYQKLLRSFQLR